jgi:hypothetical protein
MSEDLLAKIRQAVKLRNEALAAFETSRETLTSRAKEVGVLLIEARKGKTVKEFDVYLKQVEGLSLSWAYEAIVLAGGRKTVEQSRADAAERQRDKREREKQRKIEQEKAAAEAAKAVPQPEPEISVTSQKSAEPEPEAEASAEPERKPQPDRQGGARNGSPLSIFEQGAEHLRTVMSSLKPVAHASASACLISSSNRNRFALQTARNWWSSRTRPLPLT